MVPSAGCVFEWIVEQPADFGPLSHQDRPNLRSRIEEQSEHAGGQATVANAFADDLTGQFTGPRMRWMGLDDHGIACRKSGRRISASDGECQWKIARAKYGNWPQRAQQGANVRLGQWRAVGIGRIDARHGTATLFDDLREQTKLDRRASHLALQTLFRQHSFLMRSFDEILCNTFNALGDMGRRNMPLFFAWQFSIDG